MTQYEVGAHAYMRGDDFDDSRCADWQNGWLEYEAKTQQA